MPNTAACTPLLHTQGLNAATRATAHMHMQDARGKTLHAHLLCAAGQAPGYYYLAFISDGVGDARRYRYCPPLP